MTSTTKFPGPVTVAGLTSGHFTYDIDFSDLGSGASDSITMAGFPTKVIYRGCAVEIPEDEFTGEADLTVAVGYEGGDTDALVEATAAHETGVGFMDVVTGVQAAGDWLADASTAGLAVLFGATELDDVSAGSCRIHIYYDTPEAS